MYHIFLKTFLISSDPSMILDGQLGGIMEGSHLKLVVGGKISAQRGPSWLIARPNDGYQTCILQLI